MLSDYINTDNNYQNNNYNNIYQLQYAINGSSFDIIEPNSQNNNYHNNIDYTSINGVSGLDYIGYIANQTINSDHSTNPSKPNYWALLLVFFPIMTLLGNILVVLSVIKEKSLRTVTNYFVVSLALADLTVAAAVMPFAVYLEVFLYISIQSLHIIFK